MQAASQSQLLDVVGGCRELDIGESTEGGGKTVCRAGANWSEKALGIGQPETKQEQEQAQREQQRRRRAHPSGAGAWL